MDGFGTRAGFVGSVLEGDEGLLLLRGEQGTDAPRLVADHLRALTVAGARHVRVDARGASGLDAALLPVLGRAQSRLNLRRGVLTVGGLRLASSSSSAAA